MSKVILLVDDDEDNRELVKFPEKKDELLGTSFWMKLIGGIFAIIVVNTISFLTNQDFLTRLLVLIFSFALMLAIRRWNK